MNVTAALQARHSVRAYSDRELPEAIIREILDAARHAPSGANMQPWEVAVVSGEAKQRLDAALERAFRGGIAPDAAFDYYPKVWREPFKTRRKACGLKMYRALEITREDKERQKAQWAANFRAFDAPAVLFFFIDGSFSEGGLIDMGIFLQSVMLAATERGVGSCAQAALAEYSGVVREVLGISGEKRLVAGMAMGYADEEAPVNGYRTDREAAEDFTLFFR